jgi:hypothetical protein
VYLVSRFPYIIHIGISFPLDKILEHSGLAEMSMINNALHLVLFFSFEEVRWRPRVIGSMFHALTIRR